MGGQHRCGFSISYHMVMTKNNNGLRQSIQEELKSINKRQPALFANIIHVSRGVVHEWYTPSTLIFVVIHPPCNAIFITYRILISYYT